MTHDPVMTEEPATVRELANLDRLVDYSRRLPRSGRRFDQAWTALHAETQPPQLARALARTEQVVDGALGRLPRIGPAAPPTLVERQAGVDGMRIFYRASTGDVDGPPMVHLHGFGISGTYLLPTAGLLAGSYRTFVPDLPGYGRSDSPDHPLDIDELADAVARFLDVVGLDRATLVGNSLGCAVIAAFATRHTDRLDRAVLVSPAGGQHNQPWRRAMSQMLVDGTREPFRMVTVAVPDYVRFGLVDSLRLFRAMTEFPMLERLAGMDVPTLGVLGCRDPLMPTTVRVREVVASMAENVTVVRLRRVAHAANFSHPELVAHVVRCFMRGEPITSPAGSPGAVQIANPAAVAKLAD